MGFRGPDVRHVLKSYLARFPGEREGLSALLAQADAKDALGDRKNLAGHLTAAAFIFSADGKILCLEHKFLKKILVPAGHWEARDADMVATARREAKEESGQAGLTLHPWHARNGGIPFHIDTHAIPANPKKGEGAHFHHDFEYIFLSGSKATAAQEDEVSGLRWARPEETGETLAPRVEKIFRLVPELSAR